MTTAIAYLRSLSTRKPDLEKHGRKAFWVWIAYQTIKGTLTTALIWVPLLFALGGK